MADLWLKFEIDIAKPTEHWEPFGGVIFSDAFIPNRETEHIALNLSDLEGWAATANLKLWFDLSFPVRSGFMNEDGDDYDPLDNWNQPQVFCVGGGLLKGRLFLKDVAQRAFIALRDGTLGDITHIDFGMYIVKDIIYPHVSRLIQVLRYNYGQYWLQDLEPWDGDRRSDMPNRTTYAKTGESLGNYCRRVLHLKYRLENGGQWIEFVPDEPEWPTDFGDYPPTLDGRYISQQDWHDIGQLIDDSAPDQKRYAIARAIMRAHELRLMRHWDYALLSAVTALDMALQWHIEQEAAQDPAFTKLVTRKITGNKPGKTEEIVRVPSAGNKLRKLNEERPNLVRDAIISYRLAHDRLTPQLRQQRDQFSPSAGKEADIITKIYAAIGLRNQVAHEDVNATQHIEEYEARAAVRVLLEAAASLLPEMDVRLLKPLYLFADELSQPSD